MQYSQLLAFLKENSSPKTAQFNRRIINSKVPVLGCKIPVIRKAVRLFSPTVEEAEHLPCHQFLEVDLFQGIALSQAKLPFEEKSRLLEQFANTLENWAVCDSSTVKVSPKQEDYFQFFSRLATDSVPFVSRYGIVNILSNFTDDQHIQSIFKLLAEVKQGDYYVDMAIAWLISVAMVKCRNQTVSFMQEDGRQVLSCFTYNAALQKMRDSFRVSDEDKQWTKSLKRQK